MGDRLETRGGLREGEGDNEHVDGMECGKKETMQLQRDNTRQARQRKHEGADGGQV